MYATLSTRLSVENGKSYAKLAKLGEGVFRVVPCSIETRFENDRFQIRDVNAAVWVGQHEQKSSQILFR